VQKRKALSIPTISTLEQADAHQRKHGFPPLIKEQKLPALIDTVSKVKKKLRMGRRKMNQTELEFQALLAAQKANGMIQDFRFEGIRLAWGDGMSFKADFAVRQCDRSITLIEVKGARKMWRHEIPRFKGCRAEWKDWFEFELWRKDERGLWNQLA
jgi:hypothetical protein